MQYKKILFMIPCLKANNEWDSIREKVIRTLKYAVNQDSFEHLMFFSFKHGNNASTRDFVKNMYLQILLGIEFIKKRPDILDDQNVQASLTALMGKERQNIVEYFLCSSHKPSLAHLKTLSFIGSYVLNNKKQRTPGDTLGATLGDRGAVQSWRQLAESVMIGISDNEIISALKDTSNTTTFKSINQTTRCESSRATDILLPLLKVVKTNQTNAYENFPKVDGTSWSLMLKDDAVIIDEPTPRNCSPTPLSTSPSYPNNVQTGGNEMVQPVENAMSEEDGRGLIAQIERMKRTAEETKRTAEEIGREIRERTERERRERERRERERREREEKEREEREERERRERERREREQGKDETAQFFEGIGRSIEQNERREREEKERREREGREGREGATARCDSIFPPRPNQVPGINSTPRTNPFKNKNTFRKKPKKGNNTTILVIVSATVAVSLILAGTLCLIAQSNKENIKI